jgi:NTP pyrophosphatase (non-canonical NTP hydrolase)
MRKAYKQIANIISKTDLAGNTSLNMTFHLAKLTEEVGELAQGVNKRNGRKKRKGATLAEINDNIEEEAADAIQCIMAIAINAGVKYESLKKRLIEKNGVFEKAVEDKE